MQAAEYQAAPAELAEWTPGPLGAARPLVMPDLREEIWREVTDWQAEADVQALGLDGAPLDSLRVRRSVSCQDALRPLRLRSLLALDGALFVAAAYQTLLGRLPDQTGFAQFSAELAKGRTKLSVLHCMQMSAEAQSQGKRLRGLNLHYTAQRLRKWSTAPSRYRRRALRGHSTPASADPVGFSNPAALEFWPARLEQRLVEQQAALQMIATRLGALQSLQQDLTRKTMAAQTLGELSGQAVAQQHDLVAATTSLSDELRALTRRLAALELYGVAALQGEAARLS